jgi:Crp-like helix-turn-helix domain
LQASPPVGAASFYTLGAPAATSRALRLFFRHMRDDHVPSRAPDHPAIVTVSTRSFFLGTVAMVNSLRLTGWSNRVLVLDVDLTESQRAFLSTECDIVPVAQLASESLAGVAPNYFKPLVTRTDLKGVAVFLDSDVIVTDSLDSIVEDAAAGAICVFPDTRVGSRQFPEWQEVLGLRSALRRQMYVNSGLVALSVTRWRLFLERWLEVSRLDRLDKARSERRDDARVKFGFADQDTLNALLMSEVPAESVFLLDPARAPMTWRGNAVSLRNSQTLEAMHDGRRTVLLHHSAGPKPWQEGAWRRLCFDAYAVLLGRCLIADDLPLRVHPDELPPWLRGRPGLPSRLRVTGVRQLTTLVRSVVYSVPANVRTRLVPRRSQAGSGRTPLEQMIHFFVTEAGYARSLTFDFHPSELAAMLGVCVFTVSPVLRLLERRRLVERERRRIRIPDISRLRAAGPPETTDPGSFA